MIISKEKLLKEKQNTGFRQEIIEKVIWLMELLNTIADDSYLSSRLALKGGTALNLFYFDLPRLSVDADLNYIGALDPTTMKEERAEIDNRITKLFERLGLNLSRNPREHAGGKMVWQYPSKLGNRGNIEVDINFMYRTPLLPVDRRESITMAGMQVRNLQVLDIHELAAGKLTALLERQTGRDFFDANELFKFNEIDNIKLRLIFVLYCAMCTKKDLLSISIDDIVVDQKDLRNKLIPVMKKDYYDGFPSVKEWTTSIIKNVSNGFNSLLPFTQSEAKFIRAVSNGEGIKPELLDNNGGLVDYSLIRRHPALLWKAIKVNK